jgi:hypothetical protein
MGTTKTTVVDATGGYTPITYYEPRTNHGQLTQGEFKIQSCVSVSQSYSISGRVYELHSHDGYRASHEQDIFYRNKQNLRSLSTATVVDSKSRKSSIVSSIQSNRIKVTVVRFECTNLDKPELCNLPTHNQLVGADGPPQLPYGRP